MIITAENVSKYYSERAILRNIHFTISEGQSMGIIGPNGSGKTTLMRLICLLIQPSEGNILYRKDNANLTRDEVYAHIGFVGPYLELYEDLTAEENLNFFARMKGMTNSKERRDDLLSRIGLKGREGDLVKTYSSGMKQRLKYVFAFLNNPKILLIDEPRSNLDQEGIDTVYEWLTEHKKTNILIIATNDREDLTLTDWTFPVNA